MSETFQERLARLRAAQSQGNSNYPQFMSRIDMRLDMKKDDGKPSFKYYDKTAGDVYMTAPITGVLLGSAMTLYCFDQNMGKDGGSYNSTDFYSMKDNVVVFASNAQKPVFKGTAEDAVAWIFGNTQSRVSKRKTFYVTTIGGKLVKIVTNITLAIDNLNSMKKVKDSDVMLVKFTPTLYSHTDTSISTKGHDTLRKVARTNPPTYAKLDATNEYITEDIDASIGLGELLDLYEEYKKFITNGDAVKSNDSNHVADEYSAPTPDYTDEETSNITDDLPF